MAMRVTYNEGAHLSLIELNKNNSQLSKTLEKISTGQRIVGAQDDGSSYAISERMREQIRSLSQDNQNVQNGSAIVRIAERGVDQIIQTLRTMKELAIDAANDSNTNEDRRIIQKELDQCRKTIDDVAIGSQYNSKILLDGTHSKVFGVLPAGEGEESSGKPQVDVVFVVDTTGSMGSYITKVASNLKIFSDALTSKGLDWQFGLVRYDDINSDYERDIGVEAVSFESGEFTKDSEEFTRALNNLVATLGGGGDWPESGYEGVMKALESPFRSNAVKRIITITDAPVLKSDSGLGEYSSADVLGALKSSGVKLSAITYAGTADWQILSEGTGGNLYSISGSYGAQLSKEAADLRKDAENSGNMIIKGYPLWIQHGTQAGQHINVYINDMRANALGINNADVTTRENANEAIGIIENAIEIALDEATNLGAYLQRLEYTDTNITTMSENVQQSESTIRDADMAKEMVTYAKSNILTQSAQAMLAQANQNGSAVLRLLQ